MRAVFPFNTVLELYIQAEFTNHFDLSLIQCSLLIELTLIFSTLETQQLLSLLLNRYF